MTLDELEQRGHKVGRDGLPLGAGLRMLADELDCNLDDFDDHQRSAYASGWHQAARERIAGGGDP